ncbi:MAG: hypothetical protein L6R39_005229 [Caloplaca ligustica]|nr:MAG: hypothetical protein L6R39_005229 [Caloplaca ligustica]
MQSPKKFAMFRSLKRSDESDKKQQMLQPRYTMRGFEWKDQRGVEGTGFVRALRSLMTAQLPKLLPSLRHALENEIAAELGHGRLVDGATHIQIFPSMKRIVAKTNSLFFFGDELCWAFTDAALQYPQDVFVAGEVIRSLPQILASLAASLITQRHRASRAMFEHLAPVVERRLAIRGQEGPDKPVDCMQYLIDTSPRKPQWSVSRTIGEIMAVWFSSVHQLAIAGSFALEDLCLHPECIEPLRGEVEDYADPTAVSDLNALPLLDSFLKESSRLSVSDAVSVRRKALQDSDHFNGTHISKGDWVCAAQRAIMHDSDRYADPERFDGFRFVRARHAGQEGQSNRFTDTKPDWLIWGYGNTTCPGRFYASAVLRLLLRHVISNFDINLLNAKASRTRTWRSAIVPCSSTIMVLRRRAQDENGPAG